jgi:GNAT superfamily N-acetyltransferase
MSCPVVRVVLLGEDRVDEAADLCARAFQDDPLFASACPDPGERARWLPWRLRRSVWRAVLFGEVLGTAGPLAGVAVAVAPGGGTFTAGQLVRIGDERGREAIGADLWDRSATALSATLGAAQAALHRAVPAPHWHLSLLAVDPLRQGWGIGGALIRAVHARADGDGVPVVLLTYQPRNPPFYGRHGYRVVCEGTEPAGGPRWWGMRRDPGA